MSTGVKPGQFIHVTKMHNFKTIEPLYMECIRIDDADHNFEVAAGGYGFSNATNCRRGFKLRLKDKFSNDIHWHVVDADEAWAAVVAEKLLGDT